MASYSSLATPTTATQSILSLLQGLLGHSAANSAQGDLTQGVNNATSTLGSNNTQVQQLLQQLNAQNQSAVAPVAAGAGPGMQQLEADNGPGGSLSTPFSYTAEDFAKDPSYQFELSQGQQELKNQQASTGSLGSGAAEKALEDYTTGTASQAFNTDEAQALNVSNSNKQNTLAGLTEQIGAGQNAINTGVQSNEQTATNSTNSSNLTAEQIAQLQIAQAEANATGDTQKSNAISGILSGVSQSLGGSQLVKALQNSINGGANGAYVAPNAGGEYGGAGSGMYGPIDQGGASGATGTSSLAGESGWPADGAFGSTDTAASGVADGSFGAADAADVGAEAGGEAADAGVDAGVSAASDVGGAGIGSAVASFLTNPITIGIGAALLGGYAIIKATQTHPVADTFVQSVQNPFGSSLQQAVQSFNKSLPNMSPQQAQQAVQQIQAMTQSFNQAGQQFSTQGSKQATVWKQAQNTMNADFGNNFSTLINDLNAQAAQKGTA